MKRRTKIMALYADLRAELRRERESVQTRGEPDNLNEAQWALSDSELWYLGLQGAVDAPDSLERRVDAHLDANLPDDVRKDAERWQFLKKYAQSARLERGGRWWMIGSVNSESDDLSEAIDAEIKRRTERKDGET